MEDYGRLKMRPHSSFRPDRLTRRKIFGLGGATSSPSFFSSKKSLLFLLTQFLIFVPDRHNQFVGCHLKHLRQLKQRPKRKPAKAFFHCLYHPMAQVGLKSEAFLGMLRFQFAYFTQVSTENFNKHCDPAADPYRLGAQY